MEKIKNNEIAHYDKEKDNPKEHNPWATGWIEIPQGKIIHSEKPTSPLAQYEQDIYTGDF